MMEKHFEDWWLSEGIKADCPKTAAYAAYKFQAQRVNEIHSLAMNTIDKMKIDDSYSFLDWLELKMVNWFIAIAAAFPKTYNVELMDTSVMNKRKDG